MALQLVTRLTMALQLQSGEVNDDPAVGDQVNDGTAVAVRVG
jgi:hypothetical protein